MGIPGFLKGGGGSPVKNLPIPPHLTLIPFFGPELVSPPSPLRFVLKFEQNNTVLHQFQQHLGLKTVLESFISCLKHHKWVYFCLEVCIA